MIPYVGKLVLSKVSVERGVLYLDEHSLLDGPGVAVDFLVNYTELVGVHGMACGGTVEVYGTGGFEMFFDLSPNVLPDSPVHELVQLMWGHC